MLMKPMLKKISLLMCLIAPIFSDIKSANGTLAFDVLADGSEEMTLSTNGLYTGSGIAKHGLHIGGSFGIEPVVYTTDTQLNEEVAMVIAETHTSNLTLTMPPPLENGRVLEIFKISGNNMLSLWSGGNFQLAGSEDVNPGFIEIPGGVGGKVSLMSYASKWQILSLPSEHNIGYATQQLDTAELEAWYHFDGDAVDATGKHTGTITGPINSNEIYAKGISNSAFSTSSNVVDLGNWKLGQNFSFSSWVKWYGNSQHDDNVPQIIWCKRQNWGNMMFQFGIDDSLSLRFSGEHEKFSIEPTVDEWTHLVLVVEKPIDETYSANTFNATLYRNGEGVTLKKIKLGDPGDSEMPIVLGANGVDGGEPFKGEIDEVRIFKRALTKDEAFSLYREFYYPANLQNQN